MKMITKASVDERKCDRCNFTTHYLHFLYTHKRKCQKNIGFYNCSFCKRRFGSLYYYKMHKRTCAAHFRKIQALIKKSKKIAKAKSKTLDESLIPTKIVCPVCLDMFDNKDEYSLHTENANCHAIVDKQDAAELMDFSSKEEVLDANVKISNGDLLLDEMKSSDLTMPNLQITSSNQQVSNDMLTSDVQMLVANEPEISSEKNLDTEMKKEVGTSHDEVFHDERKIENLLVPNISTKKQVSELQLRARKSFPLTARKSFSFHKDPNRVSLMLQGSARKSFPNTSQKPALRLHSESTLSKSGNRCPVCHVRYEDPMDFYRHQKKHNHWGKATKTANVSCKCPFCDRQFFHVRARNAHIRNHADRSTKEIEDYLRSTTCDICCQVFISEHVKKCHMKIDQCCQKGDSTLVSYGYRNQFKNLPQNFREKLQRQPEVCPICSWCFTSPSERDKHFQAEHLDAALQCKFCPISFHKYNLLDKHMHDSHYAEFKFECTKCQINLATASQVGVHISKSHTGQDPRTLIRSRNLPQTNISDEEDEMEQAKDFFCNLCNINFQKESALIGHKKSKDHLEAEKQAERRRDSKSILSTTVKPKPALEKFTCLECSAAFSTIKEFVPHRMAHGFVGKRSPANPYTCEICKEKITKNSDVQVHLFWHLQVDSTKSHEDDDDENVDDPEHDILISPNAIDEADNSLKQSVIICTACNKSFTTQTTYDLHVSEMCTVLQEIENRDENVSTQETAFEQCPICNCLFNSKTNKIHESFCKNCVVIKKDKTNIDNLKSEIKQSNAVGACITCQLVFASQEEFSNHMLDKHRSSEESSASESPLKPSADEFGVANNKFCTVCNCIFFKLDALNTHSQFCTNSSYTTFDLDKCSDTLNAAIMLEDKAGACIACEKAFDDSISICKHMSTHKLEDPILNGLKTSIQGVSDDNAITQSALLDSEWSTGGIEKMDSVTDDVDVLRANFSKLLCSMITDDELKLHIGYGKLPIDNVVVNVLQQMGHDPQLDDGTMPDVERLHKNIKMLLNVVLQEQIIDEINRGAPPMDEMVRRALKVFDKDSGHLSNYLNYP